MKRAIVIFMVVVVAGMLSARSFNMGKFDRDMEKAQSVIHQVGGVIQSVNGSPDAAPGRQPVHFPAVQPAPSPFPTVQPAPSPYPSVQPAPLYSPSASNPSTGGSSRIKGASQKFVDSWGPVARILGETLERLSDKVVMPVKEWAEDLDGHKMILLYVFAGLLAFVPLVTFFVYAPSRGISNGLRKGVNICSALAGIAFTIWGGFEVGGTFGEWLAIAVIGFMSLAFVISVVGGVVCGRGIFFKFFAPIALLEQALLVFIVAMFATIVFICIAIVVIAISAMCGSGNGRYRCSGCGATFSYKASQCPSCGATLEW